MYAQDREIIVTEGHSEMPLLQTTAPPAKKTLSLLQIFLLNAVVCGVEICACAGFTFIPPMLLKAGYSEEHMSIILGLGPLVAFFLVPFIGRASDRCKSSYGRRRPFILGLSLLLIISLLVIPYGDVISIYLLGAGPGATSLTLFLLTMSVVVLDFTSQACLTPCEALLSDASKDTEQHERVFIVYSLMVSIGGLMGYLITAVDWNQTFLVIFFKSQERTVFSLLVILFAVLLSATMMVAQEKPFIRYTMESENKASQSDVLLNLGNGPVKLSETTTVNTDVSSPVRTRKTPKSVPKMLLKSLLNLRIVSSVLNVLYLLWVNIQEKLPDPIKRLWQVPFVLRNLALANFCSWTAVMGFNLFFTDFVGNAVFHGNANAPEDSYLRNRFDEGVRMGSWGLLLHCITSAIYAMFVERLVERFGCKATYMAGMLSFSLAMLGMVCVHDIVFVSMMAALTGFGYATLTTIPFILVTKYHADKDIYFYDVVQVETGSNPRGIGTDMATLDSAYFLSQVVLSCMMGYVVHITGTVLSYMATAGVMGFLSCFFIRKLFVNKQEILRHRQLETCNGVV